MLGNSREVFRNGVFGNRVHCPCCHIHLVMLLTQSSLEPSEASVIPCLLRSVPSHSLPIVCRENCASHSISHFSPIDKLDTKYGSRQTYRAIGSSLLEESRTEYRFWVY